MEGVPEGLSVKTMLARQPAIPFWSNGLEPNGVRSPHQPNGWVNVKKPCSASLAVGGKLQPVRAMREASASPLPSATNARMVIEPELLDGKSWWYRSPQSHETTSISENSLGQSASHDKFTRKSSHNCEIGNWGYALLPLRLQRTVDSGRLTLSSSTLSDASRAFRVL